MFRQELRPAPLSAEEWNAAHDAEGRVRSPEAICARVAKAGMEAHLRPHVWPLLLRLPAARGTAQEREAAADLDAVRYAMLQEKAQRLQSVAGAEAGASFEEAARIIAVDCPRTPLSPEFSGSRRPTAEATLSRLLRAFAAEDPVLGYCQGMSDIAAVFLSVWSAPMGGDPSAIDESACYAALAGACSLHGRLPTDRASHDSLPLPPPQLSCSASVPTSQ